MEEVPYTLRVGSRLCNPSNALRTASRVVNLLHLRQWWKHLLTYINSR